MKDQVTRENRKALPKFVGTVLLFAFLGGIGGFIVTFAGLSGVADWAETGLMGLLTAVVPWGIPVSSLVLLGIGLGLYRSAKGRYSRWDGEDEDLADGIETTLSYVLLFTSLAVILDFFFLSAAFLTSLPLIPVLCFVVSVVLSMVLQQKAVDLTRRMNPEKQVSVYDSKFQKKWYDTCDEAERSQIGQASYQAFQAANRACIALWLVLLLLSYVLPIGLLPMAAVLLIWAVLQVSYILACIRLGARGA